MITATAPGKLVLMGEYAVLHGYPAVVAAVDVRAVCTREQGALKIERDEGGLVAACLAIAGDDVDGRIVLDTSAFRSGKDKYGLGSSAAACVGLLRALKPHIPLDELHALAQRAHRNFQKGKGSGVDVCASVYGGIQRYARRADDVFDVRAVHLAGLTTVVVWTGVSVDTRSFLDEINDQRKPGSAFMRTLVEKLGRASEAFLTSRGVPERLSAVQSAFSALSGLGEWSGCDIVSAEHRAIAGIAARFGGVAKPSGAGGGDVAVCFFSSPRRAEQAIEALGVDFAVLPLTLGAAGVDVIGDGA